MKKKERKQPNAFSQNPYLVKSYTTSAKRIGRGKGEKGREKKGKEWERGKKKNSESSATEPALLVDQSLSIKYCLRERKEPNHTDTPIRCSDRSKRGCRWSVLGDPCERRDPQERKAENMHIAQNRDGGWVLFSFPASERHRGEGSHANGRCSRYYKSEMDDRLSGK